MAPWPFGLWLSIEELPAGCRTVKRERRKVALTPDVSLELNTRASIAVRSVTNETRIELVSGVTRSQPTLYPPRHS